MPELPSNGNDFPQPDLPPLREVIAQYGLRARKSLGQNFLLDLNLTGRIAHAAGDLKGATVLEIGPGPGGLTRALLNTAARKIVAVERDSRCIEALQNLKKAYPNRLCIVEADALEVDEAALLKKPSHIVANLPYNIATPLLFKWLDRLDLFDSLTLLFQKEVAERITAQPGTKAYGRLSVMTQWRCEARILFDIPGRAFTPPPKVTSSLVRLIPRAKPVAEAAPKSLERLVAAAFGQRRKMLRASLKSLVPDPLPLLEAAGVSPTLRAENVDVSGFCALAREYDQLSGATVPRAMPSQN